MAAGSPGYLMAASASVPATSLVLRCNEGASFLHVMCQLLSASAASLPPSTLAALKRGNLLSIGPDLREYCGRFDLQ